MVSLSTVGYGDLSPKTKAARLFCAAFLLVGPGQGEGQGQGSWAPLSFLLVGAAHHTPEQRATLSYTASHTLTHSSGSLSHGLCMNM